MEPFELKLHQVTFDESDGKLGHGEGQTGRQLDSLDALVHYDANFRDKTGSENPSNVADLHDLTFTKSGEEPTIHSSNKNH